MTGFDEHGEGFGEFGRLERVVGGDPSGHGGLLFRWIGCEGRSGRANCEKTRR